MARKAIERCRGRTRHGHPKRVARLALTDASPSIGLAIVDGLPWLQSLFGKVWLPIEVRDQVLRRPVARGQAAVQAGLDAGWLAVWQGASANMHLPHLDEGQAACIRIALAQGEQALLLIDERAGRAVALEDGIRVAGTATVIGIARQRGWNPSVRAAFATLHSSDFRISADVIRAVLARVGEA